MRATSGSPFIVAALGLGLLAALAAGCDAPAVPPAVAAAPGPDALARGETLYRAHCQACHGDRDGSGRVESAPPHGPDGHTWHHSDRNLVETILYGSGGQDEKLRNARGVAPDAPKMPAWNGTLTEDDARAVLAFLKTWWTPEQRSFQARIPYMSPTGWQPRDGFPE